MWWMTSCGSSEGGTVRTWPTDTGEKSLKSMEAENRWTRPIHGEVAMLDGSHSHETEANRGENYEIHLMIVPGLEQLGQQEVEQM